eukprot:112239-Chlamydomonas_euryale.AAC.2
MERGPPGQHVHQGAAKRPHVRLRRDARLRVHLLGAHKVERAGDLGAQRIANRLQHLADAKVRKHHHGARHEHVAWLQVECNDLRVCEGCTHVRGARV